MIQKLPGLPGIQYITTRENYPNGSGAEEYLRMVLVACPATLVIGPDHKVLSVNQALLCSLSVVNDLSGTSEHGVSCIGRSVRAL